jgi:hypothetical protein
MAAPSSVKPFYDQAWDMVVQTNETIQSPETHLFHGIPQVPFLEDSEKYLENYRIVFLKNESPGALHRYLRSSMELEAVRAEVWKKIREKGVEQKYQDRVISAIVSLATSRFKVGNCGEMAYYALTEMKPFNPCALVCLQSNNDETYNHAFVVFSNPENLEILKAAKTTPEFFKKLSPDAIIMDPFYRAVATGSDVKSLENEIVKTFAKDRLQMVNSVILFKSEGEVENLKKTASECYTKVDGDKLQVQIRQPINQLLAQIERLQTFVPSRLLHRINMFGAQVLVQSLNQEWVPHMPGRAFRWFKKEEGALIAIYAAESNPHVKVIQDVDGDYGVTISQ